MRFTDECTLTGGSGAVGDELVRRAERWRHYPEICERDEALNSTPPAWSSYHSQRLNGSFVISLFLSLTLPQSKELVKAYPPFVNFFEMSKETIVKCERLKPRFHAFLKVPSSAVSVFDSFWISEVAAYPSGGLLT